MCQLQPAAAAAGGPAGHQVGQRQIGGFVAADNSGKGPFRDYPFFLARIAFNRIYRLV